MKIPMLTATRLCNGPIIAPSHCASLGHNLNGPSLIRVPEWVTGAKARYYLYFAHHEGSHIRLAFADDIRGPWRVHPPGALHLHQTPFPISPPNVPQPEWAQRLGVDGLYPHIASPDVQIDAQTRQWRLWFHGLDHDGEQRSLCALSRDGLSWQVQPDVYDATYLRVFQRGEQPFALGHGGEIFALEHGQARLVRKGMFPAGFRHGAVLPRGRNLHVFWTAIGDAPERIYHSVVDISGPPANWQAAAAREILRPEFAWEGADLPVVPSIIGTAAQMENALRDPCIFTEANRVYMVYAAAGEAALGLAELTGWE